MSVSSVISEAMKRLEYVDIKACANDLNLNYELLRKVVKEGHIARDEQLLKYAEAMGIEKKLIIRLAHYERAPEEAKDYLKDLVDPRMRAHMATTGGASVAGKDRVYLEKVSDILCSGDASVISGVKSSIDAFYQMLRGKKGKE